MQRVQRKMGWKRWIFRVVTGHKGSPSRWAALRMMVGPSSFVVLVDEILQHFANSLTVM